MLTQHWARMGNQVPLDPIGPQSDVEQDDIAKRTENLAVEENSDTEENVGGRVRVPVACDRAIAGLKGEMLGWFQGIRGQLIPFRSSKHGILT